MSEAKDSELLGHILTGMFTQSVNISNALIDAHLDAAIDWATEFRKLWYRVNYANETGNALQVAGVLDDFYWKAMEAPNAIEHYKGMKMNREEAE